MHDQRRITQGGIAVGYFENDTTAVLDADFFGSELGRKLIRLGLNVLWREGVARQLLTDSDPETRRCTQVRVYQLGAWVAPAKKFISYRQLYEQYGGVNKADYKIVFDGSMPTDNPGELYELFNAAVLPKSYTGHRLSVSDVLELTVPDGFALFYVDIRDFIPIEWEETIL